MSDLRVDIVPADQQEVAEMWSNIKAQRARPALRWAWVVATVLLLVGVSATAAVVMHVMRKDAPLPEQIVVAPDPPVLPTVTEPAPPQSAPAVHHKKPRHNAAAPDPAPVVVEAPVPPSVVVDEGDLFIVGSEARANGDLKRAADAFARFVDAHASDARAPVAAMEVCRISADQLADAERGLLWAQRALAVGARGSVREDARSREVQLLGRLGRNAPCIAARDRFFDDYQDSVHAERVRKACTTD